MGPPGNVLGKKMVFSHGWHWCLGRPPGWTQDPTGGGGSPGWSHRRAGDAYRRSAPSRRRCPGTARTERGSRRPAPRPNSPDRRRWMGWPWSLLLLLDAPRWCGGGLPQCHKPPPPTPLEVPALDGLDGWMDGGRAVASTVGFGWWGEEVATPGALGPTTCRLSSVAPFNPDMCILPTEFGFPHSAFCLVSHRGGGGRLHVPHQSCPPTRRVNANLLPPFPPSRAPSTATTARRPLSGATPTAVPPGVQPDDCGDWVSPQAWAPPECSPPILSPGSPCNPDPARLVGASPCAPPLASARLQPCGVASSGSPPGPRPGAAGRPRLQAVACPQTRWRCVVSGRGRWRGSA